MSQTKFGISVGGSQAGLTTGTFDLNVNSITSNTSTIASGEYVDINVSGTATITTLISVSEIKVNDAIIELAVNNPADLLNTGYIQQYNDGIPKWSGILRSAADGKQYLLSNNPVQPNSSTLLDSVNHSDLVLKNVECASLISTNLVEARGGIRIGEANAWLIPTARGTNTDMLIYNTDNTTSWVDNTLQRSFDNSSTPQILTGGSNLSLKQTGVIPFPDPVLKILDSSDGENIILNASGNVEMEKITYRNSEVAKWKTQTDTSFRLNTYSVTPSSTTLQHSIEQNGSVSWSAGMDLTSTGILKVGNTEIKTDSIGVNGVPTGQFSIFQPSDSNDGISLYSNGGDIGGPNPLLDFKRSKGTVALPEAVVLGSGLGAFRWKAHDGTDYETGAQVAAEASQIWTSGSHGCDVIFKSCKNGSTNLVHRLVFRGNGETQICNGDGSICMTATDLGEIIIGDTIANTTEYKLPAERSITGSILRDTGSGVMGWANKLDFESKSTTVSPIIYAGDVASTVASVIIGPVGSYRAQFNSQVSVLRGLDFEGRVKEQLDVIVAEIQAKTFTTRSATIANETILSGNYQMAAAVTLGGNVVLSGSGGHVFSCGAALTFNALLNMTFINGASIDNTWFLAIGAVTSAANSIIKGNVIGLSTVAMAATMVLSGRLFSTSAAHTYAASSTVSTPAVGLSDVVTLGADLAVCSLFTSAGNITAASGDVTGYNRVACNNGIVAGFTPWNGTHAPDPETNPLVVVKFSLLLNNVEIPDSIRYVASSEYHDYFQTVIESSVICAAEAFDTITVNMEVISAKGSAKTKNRSLYLVSE